MSEPLTPYHPDDPARRPVPPLDEPAPPRAAAGQDEMLDGDDDWVEEYEEQLPHRPRRRLVTPFNLSLLGVLLVAGGFIGGVLVEKGQTSTTTSATSGVAALARRAGLTGTGTTGAGAAARSFFGGAGGSSANATTGTVSLNDHGTLYITDSEGNTIKVVQASGGTVTRTAVSSVSNIHPGDTVIVSGPKASDGTVTATSIRATAANAATGGLGSLFGGAGGGSSSTGGSSSSGAGSTSSGTPSLFGSG
jgi:hypothetical protein